MRKLSYAGLAGAAFVALAATCFTGSASAGPMSMASPKVVEPQSLTTDVYYRSTCHRHWVRRWHHHYSACTTCNRCNTCGAYGYGYPSGYGYAGNPAGYGVAAPVAAAADVATFPLAGLFGGWW